MFVSFGTNFSVCYANPEIRLRLRTFRSTPKEKTKGLKSKLQVNLHFLSVCTNFNDFVAEDTLRKGDFVTLLGKPKGSFVATDAHSRRRDKK